VSSAKKLGALCGKKRKDLTTENTKKIYAKEAKKGSIKYYVKSIK
jgi:hypothetical protein